MPAPWLSSDMGLNERNMKVMEQILDQPYGMILVVGPTGSGKTTTLHSALGRINKPGVKSGRLKTLWRLLR